jgi:hypothetical protein
VDIRAGTKAGTVAGTGLLALPRGFRLVWAGCADPVATMEEVRESDPVETGLRAVLECWRALLGEGQAKTAGEAVSECESNFVFIEDDKLTPVQKAELEAKIKKRRHELREALLAIAGVRGQLDATRLGRWLDKMKGRPIGGWKFTEAGRVSGGVVKWAVGPASGA